jgi:hypothetical protein
VSTLRTFAFGDLEAGVWGAAWIAGGAEPAVGVGTGDATSAQPVALQGDGEAEDWRADGDGVELVVSPAGASVAAAAGNGGFDQLCRVSGAFTLTGGEHRIDCLGHRGARDARRGLEDYDSIRAVAAWFEPEDGLALTALRPRKFRGHDDDDVAAAVLDPADPRAVADPRLSTTYTAAGLPARAGVELWLDEPEESEDPQYPRRAVGEAVGPSLRLRSGGVEVLAELFLWHTRGRDGAGVYLLARPA